jgi:hypothetical protein
MSTRIQENNFSSGIQENNFSSGIQENNFSSGIQENNFTSGIQENNFSSGIQENNFTYENNNSNYELTEVKIKEAHCCSICLEETETDCLESCCKHTFHKRCLLMWFVVSVKMQCPLCRIELSPKKLTPNIELNDFIDIKHILFKNQYSINLKHLSKTYYNNEEVDSTSTIKKKCQDLLECLFVLTGFSAFIILLTILQHYRVIRDD